MKNSIKIIDAFRMVVKLIVDYVVNVVKKNKGTVLMENKDSNKLRAKINKNEK